MTKNIIGNIITIVFLAVMFILCIYWYIKDDGRTEAIIVGLGFLSALITGIFFRQQNQIQMKEKNILSETEVEGDNIHIGDKKVSDKMNIERKNVVVKSKVKAKKDFRLGDDG